MERSYSCFVYITTNKSNEVLYIGMTHDLARRMYEHKNGIHEGFTKKYNVTKLVWFVQFNMTVDAIACEKRMKKFSRAKKIALIDEMNPEWRDLTEDFE